MAGVPLGIEADAEMLESGAHFPAHWRGVLADPAREDEGVDPAQDRGERADVLAELVAEERYRVGRRRLMCAHGEQHLHVRADAGHAEKAGLVIDEACERRHGKKPAIVAVAAALLTAIYHMLRTDQDYRDLGPAHFTDADRQRAADRLARRLRALGYEVSLRPAA